MTDRIAVDTVETTTPVCSDCLEPLTETQFMIIRDLMTICPDCAASNHRPEDIASVSPSAHGLIPGVTQGAPGGLCFFKERIDTKYLMSFPDPGSES